MTLYLSVDQIEQVHSLQIKSYGGSLGLRDRGALEAAVARPAMTFGGEDLYPDIPAKAAVLMHSLVMNHPYVDGNKRVGTHAAILFLEINGFLATFTPRELEKITHSTARCELDAERLAIWLRQRAAREG